MLRDGNHIGPKQHLNVTQVFSEFSNEGSKEASLDECRGKRLWWFFVMLPSYLEVYSP